MDKQRRSQEEIHRLIAEFRSSWLTRREFSERYRIAIITLDYWRHRRKSTPRLGRAESRFVLALANDRRIESGWSFNLTGN